MRHLIRLTSHCSRNSKWKNGSILLSKKPSHIVNLHNVRRQSNVASDIIVSSHHPAIPCVDNYTIPELVWKNLPIKENEVAFVSLFKILMFLTLCIIYNSQLSAKIN